MQVQRNSEDQPGKFRVSTSRYAEIRVKVTVSQGRRMIQKESRAVKIYYQWVLEKRKVVDD